MMAINPGEIQQAIVERLMTVLDPETGADVIRMRLVQDISVDIDGKVSYTFRPSSPLCPIAAPLALSIMQTVGETPGVSGQEIKVVDFIQADELTDILMSTLGMGQ